MTSNFSVDFNKLSTSSENNMVWKVDEDHVINQEIILIKDDDELEGLEKDIQKTIEAHCVIIRRNDSDNCMLGEMMLERATSSINGIFITNLKTKFW